MSVVKYFYVIYASVLFIALFFIMLPFILFFSLFGSWGRRSSWRVVRVWAFIWFALTGIRGKNIYEAAPQKGRPYIVVANHISYLDTPVIFRAIPFFVRPLATYEYAKIPLFGFLYKHLAVIIDRSNAQSKSEGVKVLRKTLDEGSSIFIFPEGKFNETGALLKDFYDGAFKIALQTGTPVLPLLFLDTEQRWSYKSFWALKPGRCRVVYLPEVHPQDLGHDLKAFKQHVFSVMEAAFARYKNIP